MNMVGGGCGSSWSQTPNNKVLPNAISTGTNIQVHEVRCDAHNDGLWSLGRFFYAPYGFLRKT